MEHKEGLKEIITRLPFVPSIPIGRKEFFIGFLIIAIVTLVLNAGLAFLLGASNLFVAGAIALIASYVVATWQTKRFLNIKPKVNAKLVQIILFVLVIAVNILTYIQAGILNEAENAVDQYIASGGPGMGSLDISEDMLFIGMVVSYLRIGLGIPLLLFNLFLFFKKGNETEIIAEK